MTLWNRWRERRRRQAVDDLQQEAGLRISRAVDLQQLADEWEHRFNLLLAQQTEVSHENSAKWFVVEMLVASHANPELLLLNWNANLPNVVDELHDNLPGVDGEPLRQVALDAWQRTLRRYTELIERTVQARREAGATPAETTLAHTDGLLYAQRSMIDILIAAHPEIQWLQRTWQLNLANKGEALANEPATLGNASLKQVRLEAWQAVAQHFTELIQASVKAHGAQRNDDQAS